MENSVRSANLDWIKATHPDLLPIVEHKYGDGYSITISRSGVPTLALGEIQIHSAYDPIIEADRLAVKALESVPVGNLVVLFGLGMGYFAEAVAKRQSSQIAVVEADPGILPVAVEHGRLASLGDARLIIDSNRDVALEKLRNFANSVGGWSKITFLHHAPSVKRFSLYYAEIESCVKAQATQLTESLAILVVTPLYGGSLPIAKYCANAFSRLGHRVEMLDNSIYDPASRQLENISADRKHRKALMDGLFNLMSDSIIAKALDKSVDLVWLVAQSPMTPHVASELRKLHIPTAFWFVEDWQYREYWKDFAGQYDYFFTIQDSGFHEALARKGVKHFKKLDLAADPDVHKPLKLNAEQLAEFGSDVSHVGAGFRNRRQVFSGLTAYDFKLWGNDWEDSGLLRRHLQRDGARISTEESVRIFNASKININLHSSQFHDGVNPDGDYLNPRTFELAAARAFQIVDHRSDLPARFKRDEEIVVFDDARELAPLIEHYLAHPDERIRIAEAGYKRVLADHTYDKRMSEALNYIFAYEPVRASTRHPNHIDNLIKDASGDDDLLSLLNELKLEGVVTLDDIVERIRMRGGPLGKAEQIYLLMYEFRRWMAEKEAA